VPHDFYPDIAKRLSAAGFVRHAAAGKGSHEKWLHPEKRLMVTVSHTKSRHSANAILKQAGLPKAF
jgi:predicted RNA binding protein YcfA (HicA-like mRNA interferase family)